MFLNKCNIISKSKKLPLVVCVRELYGFSKLLPEPCNLDISVISGYEFVTDTLIKRDIFGTLLKDTREPILENVKENKPIDLYMSRLSYSKIISSTILKCFRPIIVYDSLEDTINRDLILYDLKNDYLLECLKEVREGFIYKLFNKDYSASHELDILSDKGFCIYKSLENYLISGNYKYVNEEKGVEYV